MKMSFKGCATRSTWSSLLLAVGLLLSLSECVDLHLNLQRAQIALHPEKRVDDFVINVVPGNQHDQHDQHDKFLSQIKLLPASPSMSEGINTNTLEGVQQHAQAVDNHVKPNVFAQEQKSPPNATTTQSSSTPDSNAMEAELFDFVKTWVAKHFNKQPVDINIDTHFEKDLGADSLEKMDILLEFEKHPQGARIPDDKAANIETVGHLFEEIKAAKNKLINEQEVKK